MLRAGGKAELFTQVRSVDELAAASLSALKHSQQLTILGSGSNVLPADAGVPGVVIVNSSSTIEIGDDGTVTADTGCWFQELFLKTAQASLRGMEYAVGIPGTLGGALVSNAGAYRSNVSEFLTEIEVIVDGERRWVPKEFMRFSYRDSLLRSTNPPPVVLLRVRLALETGDAKAIYDEARDYQRQRISKQPPQASAGSFFKNVNDVALAVHLPGLPPKLKEAGVVPAGYLIESVGLRGHRLGGAMFGERHANFIVNVGGASATEIRSLARLAKRRVLEAHGVELEEEVLYIGDWRS